MLQTQTYDGALTIKEYLKALNLYPPVNVELIYEQKRVDLGQGEASILVYKHDSTEKIITLGGKNKKITERVSVDVRMVSPGDMQETRTQFYNLFDAVRNALESLVHGIKDFFNNDFRWDLIEIASVSDLSDKSVMLYRKVIDVVLTSFAVDLISLMSDYYNDMNVFQRAINITYPEGITTSYLPVKLDIAHSNIYHSGVYISNYDSVRFYSATTQEPLYYWVDGVETLWGVHYVVWVRAKVNENLIMTYGNRNYTKNVYFHSAEKVFDENYYYGTGMLNKFRSYQSDNPLSYNYENNVVYVSNPNDVRITYTSIYGVSDYLLGMSVRYTVDVGDRNVTMILQDTNGGGYYQFKLNKISNTSYCQLYKNDNLINSSSNFTWSKDEWINMMFYMENEETGYQGVYGYCNKMPGKWLDAVHQQNNINNYFPKISLTDVNGVLELKDFFYYRTTKYTASYSIGDESYKRREY